MAFWELLLLAFGVRGELAWPGTPSELWALSGQKPVRGGKKGRLRRGDRLGGAPEMRRRLREIAPGLNSRQDGLSVALYVVGSSGSSGPQVS